MFGWVAGLWWVPRLVLCAVAASSDAAQWGCGGLFESVGQDCFPP